MLNFKPSTLEYDARAEISFFAAGSAATAATKERIVASFMVAVRRDLRAMLGECWGTACFKKRKGSVVVRAGLRLYGDLCSVSKQIRSPLADKRSLMAGSL